MGLGGDARLLCWNGFLENQEFRIHDCRPSSVALEPSRAANGAAVSPKAFRRHSLGTVSLSAKMMTTVLMMITFMMIIVRCQSREFKGRLATLTRLYDAGLPAPMANSRSVAGFTTSAAE